MVESLLHFAWKNLSFRYTGLYTTKNELVEVIDMGIANPNSGPDFFNAKVRIGETIWVGNVEMHIKSSDWFAHGHQNDLQYDNVILHVVVVDDRPAVTSAGVVVPTLVVDYPVDVENNLNELTSSKSWIPCGRQIEQISIFDISMMLQRLMVERLEYKVKVVENEVEQCNGGWEEAFYRSALRCFGLKVNALPAEMLAKSLPLKILGKHRDSLTQIEALLFGQSGLLSLQNSSDIYYINLVKEYQFLKQKYSLTPIDGSLWKSLRMRPISFPNIRIAQFAKLVHSSTSLFSRLMETNTIGEVENFFKVEPSEFWKTHYMFNKSSSESSKPIGSQLIKTITLNSVVPFMFAYGSANAINSLKDKAVKFLEDIPAEDNSIVIGFRSLGLKIRSASDSQAVIHLKTTRCDQKKCLFCEVGNKLLSKRNIS